MEKLDIVGQIVGGQVGQIRIREKRGKQLELGDLLVSRDSNSTLILQVFDLVYGSQIPKDTHELMSGISMEKVPYDTEIFEPDLRNYVLASVKALAKINSKDSSVAIPKVLPPFFSEVSLVTEDDLKFLSTGDDSFYVGEIRSGSKIIDVPVWLPSKDVFSHHILIPATTGRGKSNLVKTILWYVLNEKNVGALVLDPHDEYYGRKEKGLKDHPKAKENLVYYTPNNPQSGANFLVVNLHSIRPEHFNGIVTFSDPQEGAIRTYHKAFREDWISAIILERSSPSLGDFSKSTLAVLRRVFRLTLGLDVDSDGEIICHNRIFDAGSKGLQTADQIVKDIEGGKVVVLDTSRLADEAELIIGSIIAGEVLERYQNHKAAGELEDKPVVTVVIEEAPRVLGKDVLKNEGNNIFSRIAKEGRKFQVGLTAITQLSSVIPKTILANINTKIILGNEMQQERSAVIASASQDLSADDRNIASLDKGEAIISSIFVPFAIPIKIPLFNELISNSRKETAKTKAKTRVF